MFVLRSSLRLSCTHNVVQTTTRQFSLLRTSAFVTHKVRGPKDKGGKAEVMDGPHKLSTSWAQLKKNQPPPAILADSEYPVSLYTYIYIYIYSLSCRALFSFPIYLSFSQQTSLSCWHIKYDFAV